MFINRLMEEAKDDGSDTGGGAVDRGDEVITETEGKEAEGKEAEGKEAEGKEAEGKEAEGKEAEGKEAEGKEAEGKEAEGKEAEGKPKRGVMIPKSRLDVKNREIEKLRKQLEAREATKDKDEGKGETLSVKDQLKTINKEISSAMKDGDTDKFFELQSKRDELLFEQISTSADEASSKASLSATESIKLNSTIDVVENRIPELNQDKEEFDQDLSDEVMDLYETLLASDKYNPSEALSRAVQFVTGTDISVAEEASKPAEKRKTEVEKNLKAAEGQGPDTSKAGKDSDKAGLGGDVDPTKLTMSEFDALPDSVKSRLRGDDVIAA